MRIAPAAPNWTTGESSTYDTESRLPDFVPLYSAPCRMNPGAMSEPREICCSTLVEDGITTEVATSTTTGWCRVYSTSAEQQMLRRISCSFPDSRCRPRTHAC